MGTIIKVDSDGLRVELEQKLPPKVKRFQLEDIPGVMRSRLGWTMAAALMERWFRSARFEISAPMKLGVPPYRLHQLPPALLDENAVTMAWALGFPRVHTAMAKLQAQWASPAGLELLQSRVKTQSNGRTQQCWRFGNLTQPAKVLDNTCQVNVQRIGQLSDPMDDFYGAMGEASLKVAVSGIVTPTDVGKTSIEIDEMGFYLRDSYDFSDDTFISQPLGFWSFYGVERSLRLASDVPIAGQWVRDDAAKIRSQAYLVQNKHFRQFRDQHGRGGDFMIVSDVLRVRLPFPIKLDWR
jgi:hypothetical protein